MADNPILPLTIGSVANQRHRQNTGTTDVSARHRINWVDTATVTWTVTDSSVNDEVSVSAAGASSSTVFLGSAVVTANQTGIGVGYTDITGLTVTATIPAGHHIKVSCTVAASTFIIYAIREGSTTLREFNAANGSDAAYWVLLTPSTGSHTYIVSAKQLSGAVDFTASATHPAQLLVEDLG